MTDGDEDEGMDDKTERSGWSARRKGAVAGIVAIGLIAVGVTVTSSDDDGPDGETGSARQDEVQTGDRPEPYIYVVEAEGEEGVRTLIGNGDDTPHTITSDDGIFDTGPIPPGDAARLPSLPAGEYGYHCEIHPVLTGELMIAGG
ncbi:MAG: hypothetical protein OSA99_06485 [Acidimicrobiales bacterium]|nr:hypothetical protein [Acidimicrobiales bacterium]